MPREIEKIRKFPRCTVGVARIGQLRVRIPEFIEEGMAHGLDCRQSLRRRVFQQSGDQINCLLWSSPENLIVSD